MFGINSKKSHSSHSSVETSIRLVYFHLKNVVNNKNFFNVM